jgi:hypothetical protein
MVAVPKSADVPSQYRCCRGREDGGRSDEGEGERSRNAADLGEGEGGSALWKEGSSMSKIVSGRAIVLWWRTEVEETTRRFSPSTSPLTTTKMADTVVVDDKNDHHNTLQKKDWSREFPVELWMKIISQLSYATLLAMEGTCKMFEKLLDVRIRLFHHL